MLWVCSLALLLGLQAFAYPNPGTVTGNTAVHDPTLCKDNSGKYWLFCALLLTRLIIDVLNLSSQLPHLESKSVPPLTESLGPLSEPSGPTVPVGLTNTQGHLTGT